VSTCPQLTPDQTFAILKAIERARYSEHKPERIYADEAARTAMLRYFNKGKYETTESPKAEKASMVFGLPIAAWEDLDDLALIRADAEQQLGDAIVIARGRVFCGRKHS
jgi:hypothetical protein